MISIEQYVNEPCRVSATAYWKISGFEKPSNIQVIHEKDYNSKELDRITKYFRLYHDLKKITTHDNKEFSIETVKPNKK